MKIKKILFFTLVAFMTLSYSFAKEKKNVQIVTYQTEFKLDKNNRRLCYQLLDNGKIVFIFDQAKNNLPLTKKVYLQGSFNGWTKKGSDWLLEKYNSKVWTLECELSDIMIPGNSGFPEFKYVIITDEEYTESVCGQILSRVRTKTVEPSLANPFKGFQMAGNNLILLPEDNPEDVIANIETASKLKKLKDFNLDRDEDVAVISNFRKVPGTNNLYRGYHPYKISRSELDTEEDRIRLVNKQLKDNGIKSIITLSGDEQVDPAKEQISVYVGDIRRAENQCFVKTHYNVVYYSSNTKEFGNMMADIVKFINAHPGPYYVHCRLGTDRTGVVSANLAALSGASWEEIAKDYQKTNEMGIKEFRDYRLLQYSFEHMLGKKISEIDDLQKEVSDYYIREGFLTKSEVETLNDKLKN